MPIDAGAGARTRSCRFSLTPWAVVSWFLAAGCVVDGQYLIKGRVVGWQDDAQVPLENAKISVGPAGSLDERRPTGTRADGTFQLDYFFGGMMPFVWSDGHPVVEVRAPGHRPCTARVRSDAFTPGVTRGRCPDNPGCFTIEVVLAPHDAGQGPGTTATCK